MFASFSQRIRQHQKLFWLILFVGLAATCIFLFRMPRVYSSSAIVEVTSPANLTPLIKTIHPDNHLADLVDRVGADAVVGRTDATQEDAIDELRKSLRFQTDQKSNRASVDFGSRAPEVSRQLAQGWVDRVVSLAAERSRFRDSTAAGLEEIHARDVQLATTISDLQQQLQRATADLAKFGLSSADTSSSRWMVQNARSVIADCQSRLEAANARRSAIEKQLKNTPRTLPNPAATDVANGREKQLRDQLFQLESKHRKMALNFKKEHPSLRALEKQIAEARAAYDSYSPPQSTVPRRISNPLHQQWTDQLDSESVILEGLKAELKSAERTLQQREKDAQRLLAHTALVDDLEEQLQQQRGLQQRVRLDRESAEANRDSAEASCFLVNVVEPPRKDDRVVTPGKTKFALAGILSSFLLAAGIALLCSTPEQMAAEMRPHVPTYENDVGTRVPLPQPDLRPARSRAVRMPINPF